MVHLCRGLKFNFTFRLVRQHVCYIGTYLYTVMEFSRPKSWSRGASRTKNKVLVFVLVLRLRVLVLVLEVKVLALVLVLTKKS